MHELSIYDTRTIESADFEPWMIGRPVKIIQYNKENDKWYAQYQGELKVSSVDYYNWSFILKGATEIKLSRGRRTDETPTYLRIYTVLPANYVHIKVDGSAMGDLDD